MGTDTTRREDSDAFRQQEIAFSLALGLAAVLNRDNPLVVYPDILWAFAAWLGANLVYHLALKRFHRSTCGPLAAMASNIALVSVVLAVSGGSQSSFWPMYLIPIFTSCLYLERRHVLLAVAVSAVVLADFYLEDLWASIPWEPCELIIKAGVLALAAAVTMPLARRERQHRAELQAGREKLDRLALSLEQKTAADLELVKRESLKELAPRIAHDINNPLGVIMGSVELMLEDAPEGSPRRRDLERIQAAARKCVRLTDGLFEYARSERAARTLMRRAQDETAGRIP